MISFCTGPYYHYIPMEPIQVNFSRPLKASAVDPKREALPRAKATHWKRVSVLKGYRNFIKRLGAQENLVVLQIQYISVPIPKAVDRKPWTQKLLQALNPKASPNSLVLQGITWSGTGPKDNTRKVWDSDLGFRVQANWRVDIV